MQLAGIACVLELEVVCDIIFSDVFEVVETDIYDVFTRSLGLPLIVTVIEESFKSGQKTEIIFRNVRPTQLMKDQDRERLCSD